VRRLTAAEIIEENKRIYAENNIKNLDDLNAFTLKERLENKEQLDHALNCECGYQH
jgi:hypothetical protein